MRAIEYVAYSNKRLLRLERECGEIKEATEAQLPQLEPRKAYGTTYIFRFPRALLATRRWKVAIGAAYTEVDADPPMKYFAGKSTARSVSGQTVTLSLIAILASIAGRALGVGLNPEESRSYVPPGTLGRNDDWWRGCLSNSRVCLL